MALPSPTYTFTIPSIHDDTKLSCRIYHPTKLRHADSNGPWSKKGAIVAHPYGPLGGCFDDPVLHLVGGELLRAGFVLGTFNFRGAGDSGGRTSWTARPELADYVSFYGFFLSYLHALEYTRYMEPSESESLAETSSPTHSSPSLNGSSEAGQANTILVLSGYSYGSLIAAHLPPVNVVLETFESVPVGSVEATIIEQASDLSARANKELQAKILRRGRSLEVKDAIRNSPHCVAVGSSEEGSRRSSRDSRTSIEGLRRNMSKKVASKCRSNLNESKAEVVETLPSKHVPTPDIRYLLISPLLPPVSSFTSMFSKITFTPREGSSVSQTKIICNDVDVKLTTHPSLAIYGDQDFFTSARKLRKWNEGLASKPESKFRFEEVAGAGHFWHEEGVAAKLKAVVRDWL